MLREGKNIFLARPRGAVMAFIPDREIAVADIVSKLSRVLQISCWREESVSFGCMPTG